LAQQFGQRQRGRRLDVVQQHDAFALFIEPGDRAPDHFEGVDVLPVVGDDVGAPGHQAARLQITQPVALYLTIYINELISFHSQENPRN